MLVLNSIVLVFKNSIINNVGFYWIDCLNPSVSIFMIFFMMMFTDKEIFEEWKQIFLNRNTSFRFICTGFLGLILILGFDFYMGYLTEIYNYDNSYTFNVEFTEAISKLFRKVITLIGEWFSYLTFTSFLVFIYIPFVLFAFEYTQKKLKNVNNQDG